jgi:hypothetical protein
VLPGHALADEHELLRLNINTRCGFGGYLMGLLINPANRQVLKTWSISEEEELPSQTHIGDQF